MNYLLDTCVISELVAKRPNSKVITWIDTIEEARLHLSVITIGEIRKGIEKLPRSNRRAKLNTWLNEQLLVRFSGRIVDVDTAVMLKWGQLVGMLEKNGHKLPAMDSLIAAVALHHNFALVTRNEGDFHDTEVPILNLWR